MTEPVTQVTFDKEKRERLAKAYRAAVAQKADTFVFEGHEYLTTYAKYVLEYLGDKLEVKR